MSKQISSFGAVTGSWFGGLQGGFPMRLRNLLLAFAAAVLPVEVGQSAESEVTAKQFGDVTEARVLGESDSGENWLVNGGRFTGEHYSPLTGINDGNVETLGLAWVANVPTFTLAAEPLVVDGVVYSSASLSHVFAFDAATGEKLWQFAPEVRLDFSFGNSYAARTNRGVAVWNGVVYVGTGDCRLIAIDAERGNQLWEAPVCDPTDGDRPRYHRRAPGRRRQGVHGLFRFRFRGKGLSHRLRRRNRSRTLALLDSPGRSRQGLRDPGAGNGIADLGQRLGRVWWRSRLGKESDTTR